MNKHWNWKRFRRKRLYAVLLCAAILVITAIPTIHGLETVYTATIDSPAQTTAETQATSETAVSSENQPESEPEVSQEASAEESSSQPEPPAESQVPVSSVPVSVAESSKPNSVSVQTAPTETTPVVTPPSVPVTPGSKICYLTFDDGPSDNTLRILDILAQYNAKATFFVIGRGKLEYLSNIVAAGHTVGLHSDSHEYSAVYTSEAAYFADLQAISDKVYERIGVRSNIIRFPGGSSNLVSAKYNVGIMSRLVGQVEEQGYHYFDWNVSSGDADGNKVPASKILQNIQGINYTNKTRICVLFHDTSAKSTTVEALPAVLEYLSAQGFAFESLTEDTAPFHHNVQN